MGISPALKRAQQAYRDRNTAKELYRVSVWVPKENVDELHQIAKEMREEKGIISIKKSVEANEAVMVARPMTKKTPA